jgi:hypothetical protein
VSEEIGKDIKERITNSAYLVINRVPKKTFNEFKSLANEEFCSDHGMLLKHLMDFYQGLIPKGYEHLEVEIISLRKEVEGLKALVVEKKDKKRVRLDGKVH